MAGFHEVVVTPNTVSTIEKRKLAKQSLWRVSSTLFSHIQSDHELSPLGHFSTEESRARFPPILTGNQVRKELQAIALDKSVTPTPTKVGLSG